VSSKQETALRQSIIDGCLKMNAEGINQGTSGNISARFEGRMLITPSGTPYEQMKPDMIASMSLDDGDESWEGPLKPSTEWHFHLARRCICIPPLRQFWPWRENLFLPATTWWLALAAMTYAAAGMLGTERLNFQKLQSKPSKTERHVCSPTTASLPLAQRWKKPFGRLLNSKLWPSNIIILCSLAGRSC